MFEHVIPNLIDWAIFLSIAYVVIKVTLAVSNA